MTHLATIFIRNFPFWESSQFPHECWCMITAARLVSDQAAGHWSLVKHHNHKETSESPRLRSELVFPPLTSN